MPLLNSQRKCFILIIKPNKFNSFSKSFCSGFSPTSVKSSSPNYNPLVNQQDDSYQFNEQLIKRIKRSQLFRSKFKNIKGENEETLEISNEIQKYIPSVTKIISETMTEDNIKVLEIWKAKMIKVTCYINLFLILYNFLNFVKSIT